MATFTPLAPAPTPSPLLQRQLLELLQGGRAPSTIGQGIYSAARDITRGLAIGHQRGEEAEAAARLAEEEAAANANLVDLLAGGGDREALAGMMESGGAIPAGAPAAGLGGGAGPLLPGLGGMSREQVAALVEAGGREPFVELMLQRMAPPEAISPTDQARLDLQRSGLELDRQGMALRRDQFASDQEFNRAKLDLERQGLAQAGAAAGAEAAPKFSDIRNMRLDYRDDSTPFMDLAANYEKLESSLGSGTGEGDIAAIFAFMKSLDPASTVRENEAATTQNSSGALQGMWNTYNQVLSGARLAPEQRQNFLNVSGNWLSQARDRQLNFEKQHRFQAEQAGVDPARTVPDVIGKYREWAPPEPGGSTPIQQASQGIVGSIQQFGKNLLGIDQPQAAEPPQGGTTWPERAMQRQQATVAPGGQSATGALPQAGPVPADVEQILKGFGL